MGQTIRSASEKSGHLRYLDLQGSCPVIGKSMKVEYAVGTIESRRRLVRHLLPGPREDLNSKDDLGQLSPTIDVR